ncbi:hypothetical protein E3O44_12715 [Cryobacterium algoricola]|uniref:Tail fiber protein n=1 Tax=Cryobacterium algoricola TaxID=1259183 RepID=A0ABY2IDN8_9MICO|nr:hypothetical protein [Cryobacterium algoricola]TFB85858.1 hypothetical protein E3O44_12715 [Cryobacterium algoricola]
MAKLVANYNGGSSDEYGTFKALNEAFTGQVFKGFDVAPNSTPNMTVKVNVGSGRIPTGAAPSDYYYMVSHDTTAGESVTIPTAAASPRIDYIVAYIDKSVTGALSPVNNANNVLKFADVPGTPAGSPVVPTVAQIQTAIGAANPYIILAQIAVAASATTITTPNITDSRYMIFALTNSSAGAYVATGQATSSTTYADLATTTDTVTIMVGPSGKALVGISATMFGAQQYCGFSVSGASTVAAMDSQAILINNVTSTIGSTFLVTGLTPGSNTFKLKYRVTSGTGTFVDRRIFAEAR